MDELSAGTTLIVCRLSVLSGALSMDTAVARAMRVLVVDDHPDTVEATELLLGLDGHEIATAKDGASGH